MGNFPQGAGVNKMLVPLGGFSVTAVGYHNFNYLAPQQQQWVQKNYTLHFVLKGSGELKMAGKTHRISAQQIFVVPPNVPMLYYPNPKDKWSYVWFCVEGGAEELFKTTGATLEKPVLTPRQGPHIAQLLSTLFEKDSIADAYKVTSVFFEILHCIARPKTPGARAIKPFIDRNFQSVDFTIAKLCEECHLSHAQLCRVFLKEHGISPKQYLITKRMEYAKSLLVDTSLKIDAVARSCGYTDSVNFMKEFKRRVGKTPGQYRKFNTHLLK